MHRPIPYFSTPLVPPPLSYASGIPQVTQSYYIIIFLDDMANYYWNVFCNHGENQYKRSFRTEWQLTYYDFTHGL